MEIIFAFAVTLAFVSTVAAVRWLRKWQEAEERLAGIEFEAEFEQFMLSVAADFWRNYETERHPDTTVPVADLYVGGLHAGRHWMN